MKALMHTDWQVSKYAMGQSDSYVGQYLEIWITIRTIYTFIRILILWDHAGFAQYHDEKVV